MPSTTTYIANPILNAKDAIASHIRWKITLLTAARMREGLSERATRSIDDPAECSIRRWLDSDRTLAWRGTAEYKAVVERHYRFHREMQRIAELLNRGQYADAERLLTPDSGFERASVEVANALMALDRVTKKMAS